ncbi:hypothetical protein [Acinetobacter baumannii]|uniref:hypothetical protein n=1 Tax=Acinetobacter baumannii TaxID=470 RepID=UPI003916E8AF
MSRWVSQIAYNDNEATVDLNICTCCCSLHKQDWKNNLLNMNYSKLVVLSSAYAIRLYELLIQWRSTGKNPNYRTTRI